MLQSHLGEIAALATALCWTITALAFESAGKKIGSLSVNFIRLVLAFIFIGIFTLLSRGMFLPMDAPDSAWFWLSISGAIGFVIGDLFLFQAYVEIGSRISLLIMSSVPPITAAAGFLIMGESITLLAICGMVVTIAGISIVILSRSSGEKRIKFSKPLRGIVFAVIGALGQAFGLIFSKLGMGTYNPFAATQIRIIAAIIGFSIVITVSGRWRSLYKGLTNYKAIGQTTIGAVFGPFVGVSLSLLAVQYTTTSIVSTITAISPVLIIPASVLVFKEKVPSREILGALISIIGVALLFV